MDAILKSSLDKLPQWAFHAIAGAIIIGIGLYFYKTFFITKKFNDLITDVLKRDDRIKEFQEKIDELKDEKNKKTATASQVTSTLDSATQFVDSLNDLRDNDMTPEAVFQEAEKLLQRILDVLSLDIKSLSGEKHRCGIWLRFNDNFLTLNYASAGFPSSYIGNRQLHVDRSTAGRSIRKQVVIHSSDITKDEDWEKNEDSKNQYKSLICIPFGNYAVLTIDGLEPMGEECKIIGQLYASIIHGIMNEHLKAFNAYHDDIARNNSYYQDQEVDHDEEEAV